MSTPIGRRADIPPPSWEIPAAVAAAWLMLTVLLLPAGQGAAAALFGAGWVWPHGSRPLGDSVGGLLTGRLGAGLPAVQADAVPGSMAVYGVIVLAESALLALTVWAVMMWWQMLGPGASRGMASRAQARTVLGVARLRKTRKVIRPDLYGLPGRSRT